MLCIAMLCVKPAEQRGALSAVESLDDAESCTQASLPDPCRASLPECSGSFHRARRSIRDDDRWHSPEPGMMATSRGPTMFRRNRRSRCRQPPRFRLCFPHRESDALWRSAFAPINNQSFTTRIRASFLKVFNSSRERNAHGQA